LQGFTIEIERNSRGAQTLQFAPEPEAFRERRVVKRLLPETIAREQKLAAPGIPDGERKHPEETRYASLASIFVEMNRHFGIAVRAKPVTARDEVLPQLAIIVDLAIQNHRDGFIFVRDGLMTGVKVNDAQAAYTEGARTIDVISFIVGPTVTNLVTHEPDRGVFGDTFPQDETGYATHRGAGLRNCMC
jgi:hypothetical protein